MEAVSTQLATLEATLAEMDRGGARLPYQWLFDVEHVRLELLDCYQTQSRRCGHSGSLGDPVPTLENLREAILRLSVLTIFGDFSVTFKVVMHTLHEAICNLRMHIRSDAGITLA